MAALVSRMAQGAECNPVEGRVLGAATNAPLGGSTRIAPTSQASFASMGIRHAPNHGPDFLLQARIHARVPGPVDPTDLKVRVLNIDGFSYGLPLSTQTCWR
jgi:hypothetical protein